MHLFLNIFLSSVLFWVNALDFLDCGSDLVVHRVQLDDCYESPCPVFRARPSELKIEVDRVPKMENMSYQASVNMFGQRFYDITATSLKPCVLECPLKQELHHVTVDINLVFGRRIISRPATLYVNGSYLDSRGTRSEAICIEIEVDVF